MLSKEEIEKAKEVCIKLIVYLSNFHLGGSEDIETLLQYIGRLEQENKTLKHTNKSYKGIINKLNKINDLMAISINGYDSQLDICQYSNKEEVKQYYEEYLKHFEKKVEEE